MASHKPRRRKKEDISDATSRDVARPHLGTSSSSPQFPLASFLWPAKNSVSQWVTLPLILMVVGLFRWATGFWGYSGATAIDLAMDPMLNIFIGFSIPPMYGDLEAQRHWMEITTHLPISQWYFYDLPYWGLDYPPLTAYHSWLLGKIGSIIDPRWFALDTSRGFEDQLLKVYMRATVLVSEYLVYIPAAIILNRKLGRMRGVSTWESLVALVAILMQPATILIDHAHFQYNTVMLGFTLASISSMLAGRALWGCVFFVAALCYKQMALYYAPAIFAYLIGICMVPRPNVGCLLAIAFVTILSFAISFAPLLLGSIFDQYRGIPALATKEIHLPPLITSLPFAGNEKSWYFPSLLQLTQSVHRIFPFARGLFEDKVANMWCAIHTFHKLHNYPLGQMQRISTVITSITIWPSMMIISLFPYRELLPWAMASTAWGFFLCSFQVHEKSVLLPLLPMTILLGSERGLGTEMRAWIGWANMLGVWTLFPLLKRDELRMPYGVLTLLWAYLLGLPPTSLSLYFGRQSKNGELKVLTKMLHLAFYAIMMAWHAGEAFVPPPEDKPDLWVVLNVLIGFAGFGICFLWCSWQLILRSGLMEDYFGVRLRIEAADRKKKQ
ncbi:MAG: hypothetical protein L6R36_005676 [Xanthoria steineri]|nr:MAG: hypothetical protein L6R36_005676 [Xanthoria steineri]